MNAPRSTSKPVVLVPSCNRMIGQHPFHVAGRKYIEAVRLAPESADLEGTVCV